MWLVSAALVVDRDKSSFVHVNACFVSTDDLAVRTSSNRNEDSVEGILFRRFFPSKVTINPFSQPVL